MKLPAKNGSAQFDEAFFEGLSHSTLPVGRAETLPPLCYTDETFFEFEKEAIFNHEWLCVGREEWVANPGDYFTSSIIGEPLVITRNSQRAIKAMSSVCQHRAMLVAEGHGNARALLCPYHHWAYSLDGDLIGAPAMDQTEGFEKKDFCLPTLRVECWQGFIFVNFDKAAAALGPRLRALDGVLANFDLPNARGPRPGRPSHFAWNWKVMFENNNDGYHANKLHHGPLHDFVPSGLATFPDLPEDTAGYFRFNGTTHADASFNATQKALFPIFPGLTDEERKRMVFANVPPTLSLVVTCDSVIYMILRADSAGSHYFDQGTLYAPGAMAEAAFDMLVEMSGSGVSDIVAQDLHVDELVQIGLQSRYAKRGRYSWQERSQQELNAWLVPRYQRAKMRLQADEEASLINSSRSKLAAIDVVVSK